MNRISPIQLRTVPYRRLLKRLFAGQGTPERVAFQKDILCPEETSPARPPVYEPEQLSRITGGTEHQPVENENSSMLAATYTHAPTIAYHIRDAVVYEGSIYAGNMRYCISDRSLSQQASDVRHIEQAALASSAVGCQYFGHWLRDDCVQYPLAEQTGTPICMTGELSSHQKSYAAYFGQDWSPTSAAVIDHLVIYQDYGQNSLKRSRYHELSDRLSRAFPLPQRRDGLIFLRRGQTGVLRTIENEDELLAALTGHGFEIVDVVESELARIVERLRTARLVVSIEGSQITHCTFTLARGCGLLVLEPPDRFTAVHRHWAECWGIRFGFVVGEKSASGYRFSSSEILWVAERLLS
jgi:hypothetical protein